MKIYSSFVLCSLLASSAMALDINKAFAEGKVSGDVIGHYVAKKNSGTTKDSGFSNLSIGLNYETAETDGFSAALGFRGNGKISEKEAGDYKGDVQNASAMSVAAIKYASKNAEVVLGRQEFEFEWAGDFHDGVLAKLTAIDGFTLTGAFSRRVSVVGEDEISADFENTGVDGMYIVDAAYEGIDNLSVNAYAMKASEFITAYGLKANYETELFGVLAHYAKSNTDSKLEASSGTKDGGILNVQASANVSDFAFSLGYTKTDKDGTGNINFLVDDNVHPLDEAEQVYGTDAKTLYATAGYSFNALELGLVYGKTDYESTKENKQINVTAAYALADNLSAELLYANISADQANDDYKKYLAKLTYSF